MATTAKNDYKFYDVMDYNTGEWLGRARWLPKTRDKYLRISESQTGVISAGDLEKYCGVRLAVEPTRSVYVAD